MPIETTPQKMYRGYFESPAEREEMKRIQEAKWRADAEYTMAKLSLAMGRLIIIDDEQEFEEG